MHFSGNATPRVGSAVALHMTGSLLGLGLALAAAPIHSAPQIGSCARAEAIDNASAGQPGVMQLAQAATPSLVLSENIQPALGLKFDPILNLEPVSSGDTPVYIFGRDISGQTDDWVDANVDAEFRKLGLFIKADRITHDLVKDQLSAQGQVKLFREGEFYEGPKLELKLGTTQGFFSNVSYQLTSTGGRGTAQQAEFIQPMETKLTRATYTTCPRDRPAWELRMDEMLVDQIREVGSTKSSTLYWGDVPIVPFGDASFSIGDRRKTGLLPASYRTSTKLGFEIEAPFYWNLAPNRDMTLYPRLITKRGVQLGTEFRFLEPSSMGTIVYEVLPNDRETKTTRQFGSVTTTYQPRQGLAVGLNIQRASDDTYFSDLGNTLLSSAQRLLPGALTLTAASRGWNFQAEVQEYQLLQDVASPLIKPYSVTPRLSASRNHRAVPGRDALPIDWNVTTEFTSYQHPTLAEGERAVASGAISWRHIEQGFHVTPKLSLHATHYAHRKNGDRNDTQTKYLTDPASTIYANNVGTTTDSYTRVLPTFSTEVKTTLERPVTFGQLAMEQTLEPKVSYIYTPYRDQSNYPVFDTGSPSLNFAQIFSDVAFNGQDRIADLNQITAGVTTRLVEERNGAERFRASVGQRFYLDSQRVTLPGGTIRTDRKSDLLGQITARPLRDWVTDAQAQYTPSTSRWQSISLVNRYNPRPASTLSAAYRFVRDSSNTVDLAFQWPVAPYWYAVGRYQYALRNLGGSAQNQNPGVVEALAGFEYDGGCWVGRVVVQQYAASGNEKNTAIFFQLELNGMARVGTNPLGALSRNIPNYQMINQITPLPSKFDNFQ
jgi:LPS-assembly protein